MIETLSISDTRHDGREIVRSLVEEIIASAVLFALAHESETTILAAEGQRTLFKKNNLVALAEQDMLRAESKDLVAQMLNVKAQNAKLSSDKSALKDQVRRATSLFMSARCLLCFLRRSVWRRRRRALSKRTCWMVGMAHVSACKHVL